MIRIDKKAGNTSKVSASPASAAEHLSDLLRQHLGDYESSKKKQGDSSSIGNSAFVPSETSNPRNCSAPILNELDKFEGGETERGLIQDSHRDTAIRTSDVAIRASRPQSTYGRTDTIDRLSTVNAVLTTERGMIDTKVSEKDEESGTVEDMVDEMRPEARMRLALEDEVELSAYYKTLFLGLKLNHPHNVAIMHPLFFLLRRVLYALIIVFLVDYPFFATTFLLLSCFAMLCFVVVKA